MILNVFIIRFNIKYEHSSFLWRRKQRLHLGILSLPLVSCVKYKCTVNTNSSSKSLATLSQFMIPCLTEKHKFSVFSKPILRFSANDVFFMEVSVLRLHRLLNNILFSATKRRFVCSNFCDSVTNDHFIIYLNKPFVKLQVYRIYKMMWLLLRRSIQINIAIVHRITDEVVLCSFATLDKYTFRLICIGVRPNILKIFRWMKVCWLRCQIKFTDIVLLWNVVISKKWRFFGN